MRLCLAITFLFLIFEGCAPTAQMVDTSYITYKAKELNYSDFSKSRIAILPVLAGEGYEGFRRLTGEKVSKSVALHIPQATV